MKIKSTKLVKFYYFLLAALLVCQAAVTVFKLGHTVSYQHRIAKLEKEKQELLKEQEEIELQLGQAAALSFNQAELGQDYVDIQNPILLTMDSSVALK